MAGEIVPGPSCQREMTCQASALRSDRHGLLSSGPAFSTEPEHFMGQGSYLATGYARMIGLIIY